MVYVCLCLSFEGKQTCCDRSLPGSLRRLVHSEESLRCTVTVYITSGAMASGKARGGRPELTKVGVSFRYELQTSWNVPEGLFDASIEPNEDHPLISTGLTRCPYRMTTYRDNDLASVDTSCGVQIHHPRFLEYVGAPESAQVAGSSPV